MPAGTKPLSISVTNATYTALSVQNGDGFAKPFQPGDTLKLTIVGYSANQIVTGTQTFVLADYPVGGNLSVVSQWTSVDLSSFGSDTAQLSFGLASSDVGNYGMNTPAYFAVDALTLVPVPEPASAGLLAAGGLLLYQRRRRRVPRNT